MIVSSKSGHTAKICIQTGRRKAAGTQWRVAFGRPTLLWQLGDVGRRNRTVHQGGSAMPQSIQIAAGVGGGQAALPKRSGSGSPSRINNHACQRASTFG